MDAVLGQVLFAFAVSCFGISCVDSRCYNDADCPSGSWCVSGECVSGCETDEDCGPGEYCDTLTRQCRDAECSVDGDCEPGFECRGHRCLPEGGLDCPADMVAIDDHFCMDVYEASRPDATADSGGTDDSRATSRPGVRPWFPVSLEQARRACQAADKRLCRLEEWLPACQGPDRTVYVYGDEYDPSICNSIDTFCHCGPDSSCADEDPCPFPHCRGTCGADFRVMPTGSFPDCINAWGVFDVTGNVWELADSDDGQEHFRGGAYNCGDSEALHRCDHDGTWGPSAKGFRCCSDGLE